MKTFWNVLKNDYLRTIPRIMTVTVITIVTLTTMVLAVYITGLQQVKGHVALITKNAEVLSETSKHLDITILEEKPPRSDLVRQKFDAFVTMDQMGNYQIETLRNKDFKNMVLLLLQNPNADIKDISPQRGVGVNILGFMMMFFLMISFSNLFGFADDKEQGQLRRMVSCRSLCLLCNLIGTRIHFAHNYKVRWLQYRLFSTGVCGFDDSIGLFRNCSCIVIKYLD